MWQENRVLCSFWLEWKWKINKSMSWLEWMWKKIDDKSILCRMEVKKLSQVNGLGRMNVKEIEYRSMSWVEWMWKKFMTSQFSALILVWQYVWHFTIPSFTWQQTLISIDLIKLSQKNTFCKQETTKYTAKTYLKKQNTEMTGSGPCIQETPKHVWK